MSEPKFKYDEKAPQNTQAFRGLSIIDRIFGANEPPVEVPVKRPAASDKSTHILDIDSVFGHMNFDTFKHAYSQPISLSISNNPNSLKSQEYTIKSYYSIDEKGSMKSIKSMSYLKIGVSEATDFGKLDIYLMCTDSKLSKEELQAMVYNELKASIASLNTRGASFMYAQLNSTKKRQMEPR